MHIYWTFSLPSGLPSQRRPAGCGNGYEVYLIGPKLLIIAGGDNPVDAIKMALPKQTDKAKHHKALPWKALPDFMRKLSESSAVSAKALRFLIFTACLDLPR